MVKAREAQRWRDWMLLSK